MPRIELMVGLAKPRPTLPDLDLSFQNGGCHAHGFAWAWSEPNRHAHAKPWAWHPFITHHFRTEGLVGWVEALRDPPESAKEDGGARKASTHPTKSPGRQSSAVCGHCVDRAATSTSRAGATSR